MTQQQTSALVGLLAGIAAAFLLMSAGSPSGLSFLLFSAAALPILIAGLGWSNLCGLVAVLTAMGILALTVSLQAALVCALTTLVPAAWIAHLSNLARPAEELGGPKDAMAWYPLCDILFNLAMVVLIAVVAVGASIGYGPDLVNEIVDKLVSSLKQSNSDYNPTADTVAFMKHVFVVALPAIQASMWVLMLFVSWYIASAIVRQSGLSKRPKDDIPTQLRMPQMAVGALFVGIVLSFLPGTLKLIGWTIIGTFGIGFIAAGFAIMHHRTRGKPARGLILWVAYLATLIFTLPLAFFFVLGLFDTARTLMVSKFDPPSKT